MPYGLALDANDNLLVADTGNNRIVEIDDALKNFTFTRVFGQGLADHFDSRDANHPDGITGASGMEAPVALGFDNQGNLYASDAQNSRVLEFTFSFSQGGQRSRRGSGFWTGRDRR